MTAVTVHHLDHSRSQRVLWLLEELEQPYAIEQHRRNPKTWRAPASLRAVHPLGKAPVVVLTEDDGSEIVLAESGAILEHLVETFADGRLTPPPGTAEARRHRFFLHWAEGSMMPPLVMKLILSKVKSAPMPFFVRLIAKGIVKKVDDVFTDKEIRAHLDFLESELGDRPFFCGDALTAADIQLSFPLDAAAARGGLERHRRLRAFVERIHARPAYQRALSRGGPYDLAR
ncbi:MAG: glutathione S-transferase [Sandaracinaceae bacterium]